MNKHWITDQALKNVSQFDMAMELNHPDTVSFLRNPRDYYTRVCEQCNYLDAAMLIDWPRYIGNEARILDLGCGGGWLAGYLSKLDAVTSIYALDSSRYFLNTMMPAILDIMAGRKDKIIPVEGLFSPLLLDDTSLDVVVASSVLHHAESLENLLKEIRRVLKPNGFLVILNETPSSGVRHVLATTKAFLRILRDLVFLKYRSVSASISSCGYLYDPALGDRDYPLWYWKECISRSGFSIVEVVDSNMPTVKGVKGRNLVHFVCKPL